VLAPFTTSEPERTLESNGTATSGTAAATSARQSTAGRGDGRFLPPAEGRL